MKCWGCRPILLVHLIVCTTFHIFPKDVDGNEEDVDFQMTFPHSLVNMDKMASPKTRNSGVHPTIKIEGADLGQECDLPLYDGFIVPIYQAKNREDLVDKMQALLQHLGASEGLEAKSCLTHTPPKGDEKEGVVRYLQCDSTTMKCVCNNEEPYKSVEVGTATSKSCQIENSAVGTPCRRARTDLLEEKFYGEFRKGLNAATSPKDFKEVFVKFNSDFKEYLGFHSLESDRRAACFNYDRSGNLFNTEQLECKPDGKCGCVDSGTRFSNTEIEAKGRKTCGANKDSICTLKFQKLTMASVGCAKGSPCSTLEGKYSQQITITVCNDEGGGASVIPPSIIPLVTITFAIFICTKITF